MTQNEKELAPTVISLEKRFPIGNATAWLRLRTACAVRLLPLLLFLALTAVVQARFDYTTNNGTISITGYIGPYGPVTIPDTIEGLPVTNIGGFAFYHFTSVTIPQSVTSIVHMAFSACTQLAALTVDASNSVYSSVEGVLFNKDQTSLVAYPAGGANSYTIPKSVTNIGESAFAQCPSLTNITIPNSVLSIENSAFSQCRNLATVTIGSNVTSIGIYAFDNCPNLTSIAIPNSVISIGANAFFHCTGLASVTMGASVTNIGEGMFWLCPRLTNVTIGASVTSIGDRAFSECTSLTSITIPNSVTSIGGMAFYGCSSLTGIYFKGNAPSLRGPVIDDKSKNATVYYLAGTTGWKALFDGRPTKVWTPQAPP